MWATFRRIPRHWFNAIVVVAICGLVASQIAQRTDDPERAVALVALGVLLGALAFWRLPEWQAEAARRHRQGGDKSHFELENEARRTLAEALGGLFLVVGLAFTWAQLDQSRAEQRETATLTREGQITGRFTAAVGQLGDTNLRVRLGGIYALERIARDSKDDAPAVLEVLTALVRETAPRPPPGTPTPATAGSGPGASLPADVEGVLRVIERERWADQWLPETKGWIPLGLLCLDLSRTDLRGARIHGTNLTRMCFRDADLRGARLWDEVRGGASLGGAYLTGADLRGADLKDAFLVEADLRGANLEGANLEGANLRGADLTQTLGLTQQQIASALTDATTQLPPGHQATPAAPQ